MFKLELTPTNMPRIIKLQYRAVLKSFLGNLKRRENKRSIKEATSGATTRPTMLSVIINAPHDALFKKFISLFIKNFLSPKRNRQFVFTPKIEYKLVAERSEANQNRLQFPTWCSILKVVRTHFAAAGGEESPPRNSENAAEPRR